MADKKPAKRQTYEEVRLEPWWNQAPPFSPGNKLAQRHGLEAIANRRAMDTEIDPQYLLDIEIDRWEFKTLVMVLDTVILFAHSIMEMINESPDIRPMEYMGSYSELANKANEVRESIISRSLKVYTKYAILEKDSAERLWFENSERLKLLMDAMNQCHGILQKRKVQRDKALEYDAKRNKWVVAQWIKPYKDLMNSMVATVHRLAMLMTHWTDLGSAVIDAIAEAMSDDAAD